MTLSFERTLPPSLVAQNRAGYCLSLDIYIVVNTTFIIPYFNFLDFNKSKELSMFHCR